MNEDAAMYAAAIAIGSVGSVASILLARRLDAERLIFGWALVLAAFWYIGFGLINGQTISALLPQFAAGAVFLTLAVLGLRGSVVLIGIGWILHIFWDFLGPFFGEVRAPWWTAPACLGFDVVVGTYLILRVRGFAPLSPEPVTP